MMANDGIQLYIGWPTIRKIGQLDFTRKNGKRLLRKNERKYRGGTAGDWYPKKREPILYSNCGRNTG